MSVRKLSLCGQGCDFVRSIVWTVLVLVFAMAVYWLSLTVMRDIEPEIVSQGPVLEEQDQSDQSNDSQIDSASPDDGKD